MIPKIGCGIGFCLKSHFNHLPNATMTTPNTQHPQLRQNLQRVMLSLEKSEIIIGILIIAGLFGMANNNKDLAIIVFILALIVALNKRVIDR